MNYTSVCKVCDVSDTYQNDDVEWCNECYSIEQGFIHVADFMLGIVVDEHGQLHNEHDIGVIIGSEI